MKTVLWATFLLLLAVWTGGTLVLTALSDWGAQQLASGEAVALGGAVAQWPVPGWISLWVDAAWIQAAQDSLTWALKALPAALPMLGSAVGWIAPFIWVLWGLGVILMLMLAGGAHLLLGRRQPAQPRGV